jgi:hypothetical protein
MRNNSWQSSLHMQGPATSPIYARSAMGIAGELSTTSA